ncbi:uroporphyrinogen-III synthase [Marinobacter daqiaonensis]|uniref:Uroporphyrinogen-III synthase n=1 Tax=Marinobacter daqiaonensis TaxID=650891 RepID=A0A1I6JTZ4_9GAMM|nr:uroporphyrinogen-III synthase [Marinobacter daqiaonensis]SFR82459.1 uroporphyrinogen-III synthase [Marinobacter daqiaonensis]
MGTPRDNRNGPLSRARVLICRPEPEASRLARAFREKGADTRALPAIEREPLPETPEARQLVLDLDLFQHVIAVSPFAARQLLERIDEWWPQFPTGIHWYGVGSGTAAVFRKAGLHPETPKQGYTSEALLALPSLQRLDHDQVLLARGEHGRELIRETLEQRGARVTALALYRRVLPCHPADTVKYCLDDFHPDVIVTLSGETLNNFIALSHNSGHNCHDSLLLVPVERVAREATAAGFSRVICADGMTDEDIVNRVIDCYSDSPDRKRRYPDHPDSQ